MEKTKPNFTDNIKCYVCQNHATETCFRCHQPICHLHLKLGITNAFCGECFSQLSGERNKYSRQAFWLIGAPLIVYLIIFLIFPE
jgi:hypothetical protein